MCLYPKLPSTSIFLHTLWLTFLLLFQACRDPGNLGCLVDLGSWPVSFSSLQMSALRHPSMPSAGCSMCTAIGKAFFDPSDDDEIEVGIFGELQRSAGIKVDGEWICLQRVKAWLSFCDDSHQDTCHGFRDQEVVRPPDNLLSINVEAACFCSWNGSIFCAFVCLGQRCRRGCSRNNKREHRGTPEERISIPGAT